MNEIEVFKRLLNVFGVSIGIFAILLILMILVLYKLDKKIEKDGIKK